MLKTLHPVLSLSFLVACAPMTPAAPTPTVKPILDEAAQSSAQGQLGVLVARALPGVLLDGSEVRVATLKDARTFSEGHHHETWRLTVDVDGRLASLALKIFADEGRAEANAAQFRAANAHGWPVPAEYYRGPAKPYSNKPALVMEFLSGGTLRTRIKRQFERGGAPDTGAIAATYAAVGAELGRLHKAHLRPRGDRDRSGVHGLKEVTTRCQAQGWCGKGAQDRLAYLAESIDAGAVTFVHGDLYEQQIVIGPDGGVAGFIDLDRAGFADPASDVGQLLAHVLLLNPRTREAAWQVPNPTPAETRATAEALLGAYRDAANLTGTDWANFLRRARGHMWKRFGDVLRDLQGNPHGAALVEIIDADKEAIAGSDPLADFQISP